MTADDIRPREKTILGSYTVNMRGEMKQFETVGMGKKPDPELR
jgi:hypothetical protein